MNATTQLFDGWDYLSRVSIISTVTLAALTFFISFIFSPSRKGGIRELGSFSIFTAWPFFSKRYDFLHANFQKIGESMFRFNVLHHTVIAIRGAEARKAFFNHKTLDFAEGYKILMGAAPKLSDISVLTAKCENPVEFNKKLLLLISRDRLGDLLPTLFDDLNDRMVGWGKEGRIDPFKSVYDLVFQMTTRMATCRELATDTEAVTRFQSLYWTLEKSATPAALLLPWFPSRARNATTKATTELYLMLREYVEKRKKATVPTSDAIDVLLSRGVDVDEIVGFVLTFTFAGVVNTGISACWILFFLASNLEWKNKVVAEVKALMAQRTNTVSSDALHKRLAAIPVSAWENEMPVLDSVIRETLRIVINSTLLRRNVTEDISLGDSSKTLPKGSFIAYQMADTHLNPDIYSNPLKFDPDRFSAGREEDKKAPLGFLGWGAGRHPCSGMRFAKLEIKIIVALFAAGYEFDVVDKSGNFPSLFPTPNYNDIQQARPLGEPCYLQFKRSVDYTA